MIARRLLGDSLQLPQRPSAQFLGVTDWATSSASVPPSDWEDNVAYNAQEVVRAWCLKFGIRPQIRMHTSPYSRTACLYNAVITTWQSRPDWAGIGAERGQLLHHGRGQAQWSL